MASLLPNGKQQYFDNAGLPLVGGKLYTYAAGTTNPKATYADANGQAANPNPIILDNRGEASVFWSGAYRVVLQDSLGNVIWSQDNLIEPNSNVSTSSTGSLVTPSGTTAQRDNPAVAGYFRYNTTLGCFEGYYDPNWTSFLKTINGQPIADGGDLPLKNIGGQSLTGVGQIAFKYINGLSVTGSGDIAVQPPLQSGVNLKTVGGVSLLGSGDVPVPGPTASNIFLYRNCGGF